MKISNIPTENKEVPKAKKKLLIATDTYYPKKDGVLIFLEKVVPALTDEYDITIVAPVFDKGKFRQIGDAKVVGFPVSEKLKMADYNSVKISKKNINRLKQLISEADIIWSQDLAFLGALSIYYGKKYKKPVFNYIHQVTWEHFVNVLFTSKLLKKTLSFTVRRAVKSLYNKCSVLMVPYPDLARELESRNIGSRKVIIPLGVDTNEFKPPEDKYLAKRKVGFDPKTRIIGYCGRISREKDLMTLKRAYLRLLEEYKDIGLLIVGSGPEEEMNKLRSLPNVKITGFVNNVVPYLQAMDIFVMPSLTETTSLATLEAMACKLAVVTTKVGYIKEYIIHKYNGLFFGKQNDYILRKRLGLLLNDPGTAQMLGNNARKTVEQKFSWDNTIKNIKKALSI